MLHLVVGDLSRGKAAVVAADHVRHLRAGLDGRQIPVVVIRQAVRLIRLNVRPVQAPGPQVDRIIIAAEKIIRVFIAALDADEIFIAQAVRIHQPVGVADIAVREPAAHTLEPSLFKAAIGDLDRHIGTGIAYRSGLVPKQYRPLSIFIDLDPSHAVHIEAVQGGIVIGAVAVGNPAVPVAAPILLMGCQLCARTVFAYLLQSAGSVCGIRLLEGHRLAGGLLKNDHPVFVCIGVDSIGFVHGDFSIAPGDGSLAVYLDPAGTICGQLHGIQLEPRGLQKIMVENITLECHLVELVTADLLRAAVLPAAGGEREHHHQRQYHCE